MKKQIAAGIVALVCAFMLISCGTGEEALHLGVNAVIVGIDPEQMTILVRDPGEEDLLGESCRIDCRNTELIYCSYDTGEVRDIAFTDLETGDAIILSVYDSALEALRKQENGEQTLPVEQIQLSTQRLG